MRRFLGAVQFGGRRVGLTGATHDGVVWVVVVVVVVSISFISTTPFTRTHVTHSWFLVVRSS